MPQGLEVQVLSCPPKQSEGGHEAQLFEKERRADLNEVASYFMTERR